MAARPDDVHIIVHAPCDRAQALCTLPDRSQRVRGARIGAQPPTAVVFRNGRISGAGSRLGVSLMRITIDTREDSYEDALGVLRRAYGRRACRASRRSRPRYPKRSTRAPAVQWRRNQRTGLLREPVGETRGRGSLRLRGARRRRPSGPREPRQPPSRRFRSQRSREPLARRSLDVRLPPTGRGDRGSDPHPAPQPTLHRTDSQRQCVPGPRNRGCRSVPGGGCRPR